MSGRDSGRRLLALCVLAYPRATRERDRDYLSDLGLDLAESQGFARQAWSLLGGGVKERIAIRRRRRPRRLTWAGRAVAAGLALTALAVAAGGLVGTATGAQEVEQFACVEADSSATSQLPPAGDAGCAATARLVTAREQDGWDCTARVDAAGGRQTTTWDCVLESEAVTWLRF